MANNKTNLPAKQEKGEITKPGNGRIPKKGGFYQVAPGKVEADAWRTQEDANEDNISTEIRIAEQNQDYARAIVRAYDTDGHFVDAIVHHDFETIGNKKLMEMLKKQLGGEIIKFGPYGKQKRIEVFADMSQPFITGENGKTVPNLTPEGTIKFLDDMFRFKDMSSRDAVTKAMRIAQLKILNKEWRDDDEIMAEEEEVNNINGGKDVKKTTQENVDNGKQKTEEKTQGTDKKEEKKDTKQEGKKEPEITQEEIHKKNMERLKKKPKTKKKEVSQDVPEEKPQADPEPEVTEVKGGSPTGGDELTREELTEMDGGQVVRRVIGYMEAHEEEIKPSTIGKHLQRLKHNKWISKSVYSSARLYASDLYYGEKD